MPQAEDDIRIGEVPNSSQRPLSIEERLQMKQLLDLEQEFIACLQRLAKTRPGGMTRCISLAKTNMQQARMWAIEEIVAPSG